ncbi:MAG: ribosome-associated ATPase/putative transporter RbbA [Hyphomicrobiaceae bacterium]
MGAIEQPVVEIVGLSHSYKSTLALQGVSIDIPPSQMVGLLGPDGVGKSTLLGLVSGARKIQQGRIKLLGGDMASHRHRNEVGPRIAYMPQGLGKNLYHELSIAENLDFFGKLYAQTRAERTARIDRLTIATGLHPFLKRPAGKLSGGMKQKLGLCCALIHDPDLLILDEPTTGVDPLARRQFWELIAAIKDERPNMSVLVSTAYMEEAESFDWLVAMNAGRILDANSPDALKQNTNADSLEEAFVRLLPGEERRRGIVMEPRSIAGGPKKMAIVARNLTRRFGDFTAVDRVSFEIEEGEIFGFLGSNGCGKTTTMKMLTGLLPSSEGEAHLFGKPVDAHDLETRNRVGFMSQSFSLYGELTVSQNLDLHARLFHLRANKREDRIQQLVRRFGLSAHMDAFASALPLGLRQRLSLAVAILHEPEMLILDEPTSGVDPVARDEFWELLVELSRRDKVTIFISTHYMNEALRCDRISLMHAGKVLVCNTPEEIIAERNADTLEEAFVAYIENAIVQPGPTEAVIIESVMPTDNNVESAVFDDRTRSLRYAFFGFSPWRALAFSYRETTEVLRDPVRLAFAFIGSTILLFIFSYGITTDVDQVRFAVFDQDRSPESRAYLRTFRGSRYFSERPEIESQADLEQRFKSHSIAVSILVPPLFGRELKRGGQPEVSVWVDGANTMRASTIDGYVAGVHQYYLATRTDLTGQLAMKNPLARIEMRYLYNPSFESIFAIGPAVPAMLLILFPAILMAVSVTREKEIGTITNFYVTPTRRLEFLLGKQFPYIAIAMLNYLIMTCVVIFLFGVPLKGSFLALTLGALAFAAATTAYGLVIATVTSSQVAAVFATAILSLMPTFQFSGFLQPVSALEGGASVIGNLWPATYYMHMSVGAFTKGLGFAELMPDLLALCAFIPVFLAVSVFGLRKQEQ